MTRRVLFVQGGGEGTHDQWDNKLVASLERELGEGYALRYPRMPNEDNPRYDEWKEALVREFEALKDGGVLVGHSMGAAILIHALAEQPPSGSRFRGIFLIAAPYIGEGGWPSDDIEPRKGLSECLPADVPIFLYHGAADETAPVAHVHLYAKALPRAVVRTFEGRDHQLDNDLSPIARDIRSLT